MQDVVFLDENETVTVIARFHPWTGQYMCKLLLHNIFWTSDLLTTQSTAIILFMKITI